MSEDQYAVTSDPRDVEEPDPSGLQRESGEVNELNGVVAFCAGVLAEIQRCGSLEEAKTVAKMGAQALEERRSGLWKPGPHDDPANWRRP